MMKINFKNPLFILGLGLVLVAGSVFGSTKASDTPKAEKVEFKTVKIGVELLEEQKTNSGTEFVTVSKKNEDGTEATSNLKLDSLEAVRNGSELLQVGKEYPENIKVVNPSESGSDKYEQGDAYVRVVVRKYWVDDEGEKDTRIDPSVINLKAAEGWGKTETESGEEAIYYSKKPIKAGEESSVISAISFDDSVNDYLYYMKSTQTTTATKTDDGLIIESVRTYGGQTFKVEMRVEAVQTHNAKDAMLGAWGVDAAFDGETIKSIDGTDL